MVTFIHGFGMLGIDGLIEVNVNRCVVNLQGSWGFWMTQFLQGRHNWARLLCVMIGGSNSHLCY